MPRRPQQSLPQREAVRVKLDVPSSPLHLIGCTHPPWPGLSWQLVPPPSLPTLVTARLAVVAVVVWTMSVLPPDANLCEGHVCALRLPVPKGAWHVSEPREAFICWLMTGKQRETEKEGPGAHGVGRVCGQSGSRVSHMWMPLGRTSRQRQMADQLCCFLVKFYVFVFQFLCHQHLLLCIVLEAKCKAENKSGLSPSLSWASYSDRTCSWTQDGCPYSPP